jgi:uncharacterized protein
MSLRLAGLALGLGILTGIMGSAPAKAASFDCTDIRYSAEVAVCRNHHLSRLDDRMADKYREVSGQLSEWARDSLRGTQRDWIDRRNACGPNRACIDSVYHRRLAQLSRYDSCFDHTAPRHCVRDLLRRHANSW